MGIDAQFHIGAFALAVASFVCGCGDDAGTNSTAWSPEDTGAAISSSSVGAADESGDESGETSMTSTGGTDDCSVAGDCEGSEDSSAGDPTTGDSGEPASEVCFPGEDSSYSTCFDLVAYDPVPEGYTYPAPLNGQASYRKPIAFIDIEGLDPGLLLAPNFQLSEIAQLDQGRYAIIQPHAIESLQTLRDMLGSLTVNAGYRSPSSDVGSEGAAPYSRHMYGDGFDLVPGAASLSDLSAACTDIGGFSIEYGSYIHCDFRDDPLDPAFFGAASTSD